MNLQKAIVRGDEPFVPPLLALSFPAQKDGATPAPLHSRPLVCAVTMHSDPTYPLLPVFAFLGFIVALIPLPWHLQAWNAGTCVYMIWASFACLIQFVNAIVWRDTALDYAPVWCDISEPAFTSDRARPADLPLRV